MTDKINDGAHTDPFAALIAALGTAVDTALTDVEIEDALVSEGIHTWGPDGERFERMFAVVMQIRADKAGEIAAAAIVARAKGGAK